MTRKILDIARDHGQMMMKRCGGQQPIDHRQGRALTLRIAGEFSPVIGHGRIDRQQTAGKSTRQFNVEPHLEVRSTLTNFENSQALADFSQGQHTQEQQRLVHRIEPLRDSGFRSGSRQFRNDIRVEQKSAHKSISRPLSRSRSSLRSSPASGERLKNSTRLFGCWDRATSASNWAAGKTTTASRPPRVMSWGPLASASRKTSLKRALAVCSCQAAPL